ncbi:VOC family protein [Candidatus Parcubacteria bacterium]|nr:VOC family protein [Candidatus Parcubacteria bacterium]
MNPVVHFEMPYEDRDRAAKFYESAFGWKFQMMGPEMGNYAVAITSETADPSGKPDTPGSINGGFYKKSADPSSHCPSFVIAVKDIREAMKKVEAAGGTVVGSKDKPGEPDMIPGIGLWISAKDSEGNRISILEPSGQM